MRTREVQTRATDQRGRTTTPEAFDQGSDQGLHDGFVDGGQQWQTIKSCQKATNQYLLINFSLSNPVYLDLRIFPFVAGYTQI